MLVGAVIVAAHAPSPKDTAAIAIPMIKSSFGFVIVVFVSYLYIFFYVSHLEYLEMLLLVVFSNSI
jgi:hypothetical protein